MGTSEQDRAEWKIPVRDAVLGRPRQIIVAAVETRVVMVPPPGEGIDIPDESIQSLCDALNASLSVAKNRRKHGGERS